MGLKIFYLVQGLFVWLNKHSIPYRHKVFNSLKGRLQTSDLSSYRKGQGRKQGDCFNDTKEL